MDRFDRELFLSAFHSDAVIAAGAFVGGPVELYDWASELHEQGQVATHHNLLNHTLRHRRQHRSHGNLLSIRRPQS